MIQRNTIIKERNTLKKILCFIYTFSHRKQKDVWELNPKKYIDEATKMKKEMKEGEEETYRNKEMKAGEKEMYKNKEMKEGEKEIYKKKKTKKRKETWNERVELESHKLNNIWQNSWFKWKIIA